MFIELQPNGKTVSIHLDVESKEVLELSNIAEFFADLKFCDNCTINDVDFAKQLHSELEFYINSK